MLVEWLFYGLLAAAILFAAFLPAALGLCRFRSVARVLVLGVAVTGLIALGQRLRPVPSAQARNESALPRSRDDGEYIGSAACRKCHSAHYESWHATYHRTMTQLATPETVVAPFDGRELNSYGLSARVERRGDEFWVDMPDPRWLLSSLARGQNPSVIPDPPRIARPIVMTTGSHHFQVFWYPSEDDRTGELWQFPWRYHIAEQRWMHQDDVFLHSPPARPGLGHRVWNGACIECHSVAGQAGWSDAEKTFSETRVAELGIACEACHGPGAKHASAAERSEPSAEMIVNPRECSPEISVQICGSCHGHFAYEEPSVVARRRTSGREVRPGEDLNNMLRFLSVADESTFRDGDQEIAVTRFWADGACRSGGREYNGLVESRCHTAGALTCLQCHSMHDAPPDDQLAWGMDTNEACYQCHTAFRDDLSAHTHHSADSSGSLCYNCHMPYTSFALLKGIRSHRIDSPNVTPLFSNSRLNACNQCHLDQTLAWTGEHLESWYSIAQTELTDEERTIAASLLWLLRGDAGQRASVAWSFGWASAREISGSVWMVPFLAELIDDPYAAVRFNAFKSLQQIRGYESIRNEFDSPAHDRRKSKLAVLKQWHDAWAGSREPACDELLLNERGPDAERVERLLRARDHRSIVVVE